jgi:hypothetical protein
VAVCGGLTNAPGGFAAPSGSSVHCLKKSVNFAKCEIHMPSLKDEFESGMEKSRTRNFSGAILRACFHGALLAVIIWGPFWVWWGRFILCAFIALVVGMVATRYREMRK